LTSRQLSSKEGHTGAEDYGIGRGDTDYRLGLKELLGKKDACYHLTSDFTANLTLTLKEQLFGCVCIHQKPNGTSDNYVF
jgi:hypothetical protein